ncbi:PIN-like domain-containing protein [Rummeliibacillus pycnus]|uniref:PIN-like domain-containing protein n=1 Tax=Rummeliibacillus pycnus TaxID=101070 RepID=UPI000C9C8FBD|nr:PIN domain-containing protein [Rummeliibacillus pycnus]
MATKKSEKADIKSIKSDASIDIEKLITNNYVIVCDTNVFLGLYRHSPDYANFALECLREIEEYIVLPYTAKIEYYRNHKSQFKNRQDSMERSVTNTLNLVELQRTKLKNSYALSTRHFPEADKFENEIDQKYNELKTMLTDYFDDRSVLTFIGETTWTSDKVEELVKELESNNQIMNDFTRDEIYTICEEGKKRYKASTPPGYGDAKDKDGIQKYSDLILWKEVIRYAKERQKNIIFVTDDVKPDWWITDNKPYEFLPQLIDEFEKDTKIRESANNGKAGVPMKIVPFVSEDFFNAISTSMDVQKSDAVEQALEITEEDYIANIKDSVFDSAYTILQYSGFDYIEESILTDFGSNGIDEWELDRQDFIGYTMIEREGERIIYHLEYEVELSANSYEYWGRDDDTKEVINSPAYSHRVMGEITVRVVRIVNMFVDFEYSDEYESAEIIDTSFEETHYQSCYDDDEYDDDGVPDFYNTCPECNTKINIENDGGNGFCINCAPDH